MKITEQGEYIYLELPLPQVPELHGLRRFHRPHKCIYVTSADQDWLHTEWLGDGHIYFGDDREHAIAIRPAFDADWLQLDREHPTHFLISGNALFISESGKTEWLACQIRVQLRTAALRVRTTDLAMASYRDVVERVLAGIGSSNTTP